MMRRNNARMVLGSELKEKIMTLCVNEFLRVHPEMSEMKITEHKILSEMAEYYLTK